MFRSLAPPAPHMAPPGGHMHMGPPGTHMGMGPPGGHMGPPGSHMGVGPPREHMGFSGAPFPPFAPMGPPPMAPLAPPVAPLALAPMSALANVPRAAPVQAAKPGFLPADPKPKLFLLLTRLPADVEDSQLQEVLEQCGEVKGLRRARDESGEPLAFAFAQFEDPEVAWKASTCLSGLKLKGHELKCLLEEAADAHIQKWRSLQRAVLKAKSEEELNWELERKSVSCKSQIDAKVAEIFGGTDESGGAYIAEKTRELREREQARLSRGSKRKAWLEAEFGKQLEKVESVEKRLRREEVERDLADKQEEESEMKKEDPDAKPKVEDNTASTEAVRADLADDQQLMRLVDRVQAEPREDLFKIHLDVPFLRHERVFENKLRPWLERKVELFMGGQQSDLVEYILRRVNGAPHPEALMSDLMRYLDDHAEPLVERMWRMLVFELHRGGLVLQDPLKWEDD